MKVTSLLISLLMLLSALSVSAQDSSDSLFSFQGNTLKYNMSIQRKEMNITGICMMRRTGNDIIGSVVNEFGIKAFDFDYNIDKKKVKLNNVVGFINKWYIRKILKGDLKYLFSYGKNMEKDKNRDVIIGADKSIEMDNNKFHLKYVFTPLNDLNE
jgi:hypothetical protein